MYNKSNDPQCIYDEMIKFSHILQKSEEYNSIGKELSILITERVWTTSTELLEELRKLLVKYVEKAGQIERQRSNVIRAEKIINGIDSLFKIK